MAKGFSKNNPLDKLSGTSVPKIKDVQKEPMAAVEPKQTEMEQKQEKPQTAQKRKAGRPKTKDIKNTCKKIKHEYTCSLSLGHSVNSTWEYIAICLIC